MSNSFRFCNSLANYNTCMAEFYNLAYFAVLSFNSFKEVFAFKASAFKAFAFKVFTFKAFALTKFNNNINVGLSLFYWVLWDLPS